MNYGIQSARKCLTTKINRLWHQAQKNQEAAAESAHQQAHRAEVYAHTWSPSVELQVNQVQHRSNPPINGKKIKLQVLPLPALHPNEGQVEGLPKNPRFIRDPKFKKLVKSIQDDPEMLELRELIVYDTSDERGFVIFGGSGTTLIAAEQLGRCCRMVEFEPIYVDVIIKRWEELTAEGSTHQEYTRTQKK